MAGNIFFLNLFEFGWRQKGKATNGEKLKNVSLEYQLASRDIAEEKGGPGRERRKKRRGKRERRERKRKEKERMEEIDRG